MRPRFTPEELQTAQNIASNWDTVGGFLFFGGILGAVLAGVRQWSFGKTWLVTFVGMVGGYIIWDIVLCNSVERYRLGILSMIPGDYGEQPGIPAAAFISLPTAYIFRGMGKGIRRLFMLGRPQTPNGLDIK